MALKTFPGGIHPRDRKGYSKNMLISDIPLPSKVVIFLSQHIGGFATPVVKVGDMVKTGQMIAEPTGFVSIPMHASISGKVSAIDDFPHPNGAMVRGVEIESDGKDEWVELVDDPSYMMLSPDEMRKRILDAGICGMGGAGFPTHVKLTPPPDKPIDTVIVNGVECEPFLTADYRLMVEFTEKIVNGLKLIMNIVGAKRGIIGIEANKPQSIEQMRDITRLEPNIRVDALAIKYPQGAEKQLIYATTKRKVPNRGGLPNAVGCIVDNVATTVNVHDAIRYRKPLVERIITVSGKIIKNPANMNTRIGTKFSDMVEFCGGLTQPLGKIISGGPMMGFALNSLETYSTKTTSGIILLSQAKIEKEIEHTCLRCARCVDVCPCNLMPCFIALSMKYGDTEGADQAGAMDCMKCGCCAYVCPAHIRLIQWIDIAKLSISRKK